MLYNIFGTGSTGCYGKMLEWRCGGRYKDSQNLRVEVLQEE